MQKRPLSIVLAVLALLAAGGAIAYHFMPASIPGATDPVTLACPSCGQKTASTFQAVLRAATRSEAYSGYNGRWMSKCPSCGKWATVLRPGESQTASGLPPGAKLQDP